MSSVEGTFKVANDKIVSKFDANFTYTSPVPSSIDSDYYAQIAKGEIADEVGLNKFGATTNIDSGTDTDIWDGAVDPSQVIWVPPTAARIHDIASDDTDDSSAGNGARTVRIYGLDVNWEEQTEVINMNGTTNVPTANTYTRIFRMEVLTFGLSATNEGDITAIAQTDNTETARITARITAGKAQTLMAIYTVPANKTLYMIEYYVSIRRGTPSNASFDIALLTKENVDTSTTGYVTKYEQGVFVNGGSPFGHPFRPYLPVPEKTDIVMRALNCTDNNTTATAGFDGILKNNG